MKKTKISVIAAILAVIGFAALSFSGCVAPEEEKETIKNNAVELVQGEWADGNLSAVTDEQWFTFVATDNTQSIFFEPGTMSLGKLQLYESNAVTVNGKEQILFGSVIVSQTTYNEINYSSGNRYYIKMSVNSNVVANYPDKTSGTFKIAFSSNTSPAITLPTENVTDLTVNTWTAGDISSALGEKWYKFTANATTQYIQFELGTLSMMFVQLYDNTGKTVGDSATIMSTTLNFSRTVTSGSVYYVRVTALAAGTYKIGYTDSTTPPPITLPTENVTELTVNTLTDGSIATAGGIQWFKFTATVTGAQYIHFRPGALDDVYVQLYKVNGNTGTAVGEATRLRDSTPYTSQTVTTGQDYYIKVTPYSSSKSGAYKITFSASFTLGTVTNLTEKVWADGELESKTDEEWFKFKASAATQYIHFKASDSYDNLYGVDIQLYDTNGTKVGDKEYIAGYKRYATLTVTSGNDYYIKVTPYSSIGSDWEDGTYNITFSSLSFSPDIIQLTSDKWADNRLASSSDENWFEFTAGSTTTHYIHFYPGTASYLYVHLFDVAGTELSINDNDGTSSANGINMSISTSYVSFTPANGNTYYIKVTPYSSYSGTYKIGYNTGKTPPPLDLTEIEATQLTAADTFADGNLANSSAVQWFKFTATSTTKYILYKAGTTGTPLTSVTIQLYDKDGRKVGDSTQLSVYSSPLSLTLPATDEYYIKVTTGYYTGTYQIAYSSTFAPAGTVIDLNIGTAWISGTLTSSGEQWFKYVASADAALYFHLKGGTGNTVLTSAYTQIYENEVSVGDSVLLNSRNPSPLTVKNGKTYYIKVTKSSSSGNTYDIALTASPMPIGTTSTDITVGTWNDSNITGGGQLWFKFTATANPQYIHFSPGTLSGVDVQLYDFTTGAAVDKSEYLASYRLYVSRTVTSGKAYYIKVSSLLSAGTYKIGVTASTTPPTTP